MTDSERLNTRLERAARRATGEPRPVGGDVVDLVARIARQHMRKPENFRPATDEEIRDKIRADQLEWRRDKARIMLSRLPSRYQSAQLEPTTQGIQAMKWIKDYRAGRRASLVILGPTGCGKTWLAAAMARSLMVDERPVPVTFTTHQVMLDTIKGARPGSDPDLILFTSAPVLVIDDLGAEYQTAWTDAQLFNIAHERSHNNRPIIATSNLQPTQLRERYDERTLERLFGGGTLIQFDGESRRTMPF